jgi:hypothetical protein
MAIGYFLKLKYAVRADMVCLPGVVDQPRKELSAPDEILAIRGNSDVMLFTT